MSLQKLTTADRILLAQELWDSVREASNDLPLTPEQQRLLDERLAALEAARDPGDTWENVKRRIARP